ncbi:MAG: amidase [Pseudomonadota bacterium]
MSETGPIVNRTSALLARIEEINKHLQAFVSIAKDDALRSANACDLRLRDRKNSGPMDGMSVAVKDNIAVAGLPTTAGIGAFRDRLTSRDSAVVSRLRAAGAILLGTLNMDEGALGATTNNPFFGRCENPLASGYTPGGSSGGSAAAVAAGLVPLALGTDTMGSVRIPAAYCGIWGLKPTAGLIGETGLLHLSWTLDTIGLLADSAERIAHGLDAVAGFDPDDPSSIAPRDAWSAQFSSLEDLKGVVLGRPTALSEVPLTPDVAQAFEAAQEIAASLGATIRDVDIRGWDPGKLRRAGLLAVEAEGACLLDDEVKRDPDGFSEGFKSLLAYGRSAPAVKLAAAYHKLRAVGHATRRALSEFDALILPTAPQTAFPHDAPVPSNQADLTALANAAGCPALSFPWPTKAGGLPAGIQLVGAPYSEAKLLSMATAIHRAR